MISPKYIELMNQELDGANSPEQTRDLEKYLRDNEEAQTYYRELAMALNVFEEAAMVDPPAELFEGIVARLHPDADFLHQTDPARNGPGLWAACRNLVRFRPVPAFALTFAAGIACGLLLYAGSSWLDLRHGAELSGQVSGTANHRSWNQGVVDEGEWHLAGSEGIYRVHQDGRTLRLHLEIMATRPVVVRFNHDAHLSLQHFSNDSPSPSGLTVSDTLVEVNHQGTGSYDLEFLQDAKNRSPIMMSIHAEGRLVHTKSLNASNAEQEIAH
ncbi:MAG: hypothetical protein ABFS42_02955 [Candidatus Krumholzibacteriota bacterium]